MAIGALIHIITPIQDMGMEVIMEVVDIMVAVLAGHQALVQIVKEEWEEIQAE